VYKANVAFTVFARDLFLSFYKFATYLKGTNSCKSINLNNKVYTYSETSIEQRPGTGKKFVRYNEVSLYRASFPYNLLQLDL